MSTQMDKLLATQEKTRQKLLKAQEEEKQNVEWCIERAKAYVGFEKLDGYILHELISAIYVSAPDKNSGYRVQHIRIEYNGIGFIPIHELMAKQMA